jgi:hypothetical protein
MYKASEGRNDSEQKLIVILKKNALLVFIGKILAKSNKSILFCFGPFLKKNIRIIFQLRKIHDASKFTAVCEMNPGFVRKSTKSAQTEDSKLKNTKDNSLFYHHKNS